MSDSNNSELMDLTFKSIIDALPCYIMIQDQDYKILFANQKLKSDFGDDIISLSCYSVLKGSHHQCNVCPVRKTFKDKKVHIIEETIHLSDGTVIEMIAYSAPLFDAVGNVRACIKLLVNVGTIKDTHRELVTLGQSIALLSHDIKNILEGLQGGAYVVEEGIKDADTELSGRGWDIVKKNITEITGITQNILYSAKERKPKMKIISPVEVARQTGQLFAEKASSMGIQLLLQLNPKVPRVSLDPTGISRMLGNLLWNSLQACHTNTEKSKHIVYVRVDYYDYNHFMYEVEDNAYGMDTQIRKNLFKEFFSSKGDSGTGLGLMVVERIIRNHQGKIEVLTKPGKGSLFRIIFRLDNKKLDLN
ncbi:MAG: GHKL domain-containing protein [Desulfobacula sp.]|jgi:signal transduction histidine kinase|uniref:ATP-binding protein n=1 Tax=Desulfobacula sp. TaxID=2593537 RepID=UPI001D2022DF|nr:GHKL domain-containing protein [Desulfobacula sp.]MBT3485518.1 GHKL domain-containing protein [Desulfobacula sp.]MBT3805335.1 GHKL domain-containing protein [Desulfobacula sp.]MBT4025687.1 GHKL domain-containing protein [Desulfobacula sp.]MBT4197500.1 GHKL domain-containing protein [Desulfobacula sp.]